MNLGKFYETKILFCVIIVSLVMIVIAGTSYRFGKIVGHNLASKELSWAIQKESEKAREEPLSWTTEAGPKPIDKAPTIDQYNVVGYNFLWTQGSKIIKCVGVDIKNSSLSTQEESLVLSSEYFNAQGKAMCMITKCPGCIPLEVNGRVK